MDTVRNFSFSVPNFSWHDLEAHLILYVAQNVQRCTFSSLNKDYFHFNLFLIVFSFNTSPFVTKLHFSYFASPESFAPNFWTFHRNVTT